MNRRIAKKIVQSCAAGHAHYTPTQIRIAHQIMGKEIPTRTVEIKRARNDEGHFIPDDPTTTTTDEAWVGGVAPTAYTVKELRSMAKDKGITGYSRMTKDNLMTTLGL